MWTKSEPPGALGPGAVQVWAAPIPEGPVPEAHLAMLAPEEQARAARFKSVEARAQFVAGRVVLRRILGEALGVPPEALSIRIAGRGKPYLEQAGGAGPRIEFSLAHTQGLALLAVTRGRRIGVDVESASRRCEGERIMRRYFSPGEVAAIQSLPEAARDRAFLRCWTRKEAFIKALGEGLHFPLDGFDVSVDSDDVAALLAVRDDPGEAARWRIEPLQPHPGYVAALAVEGKDWTLDCVVVPFPVKPFVDLTGGFLSGPAAT